MDTEPTFRTELRDEDGTRVIHLEGELLNVEAPALARMIAKLDLEEGQDLILDLSAIERLDSAGVAVILESHERLKKKGNSLRVRGAADNVRKVFSISLARVDELAAESASAFWDPVTSAGEAALRAGQRIEEFAVQAGDVSYWLLLAPLRGFAIRFRETIRQAGFIGADAVPIVSLISLLVGLIMAMQAADQLRQFGASIFVADLVGISVTRELGPLMTAIIVSGRSGASIAAELGTMVVSEEIDALRTMGLNPTRYLVIPRLLALLIAMPCLVVIGDAVAIFGGFLIGTLNLGIAASTYWNQTIQALYISDILTGLVKAAVFGAVIANVAVFQGFHVRGGAEAVGRATTASVVTSILLVIIADAIFTALFYAFG